MKKYMLLIACLLLMLIPMPAFAAQVTKVVITTEEPVVGEKSSFKASVPQTASTEVYEVHWHGEFENGRFVQGNDYTMTVKLRIKASSKNVFAPSPNIKATINEHKAKVVNGEYKTISVKYTWKELGGPNPNNPKTKLKTQLAEIAATYTAVNTDDDKVLIKYLNSKLPGAKIWSTGVSYKYTRKMPSETHDGKITVPIGITYNGVTLDSYNFSVVLPALGKSPEAAKLNADIELMKTALKNLTVTAKTTGEDILAVVNAAAANGSTAVWDEDYKYNAPTAKVQGSIDGNIIIALGSNKDYFHAHKTLPIAGTVADAAIDADFSALSKALHNHLVNNSTTQQELIDIATSALKNGSKLTFVNFTKTDATYDNDGKIVISFDLQYEDIRRSPRISMKLSKLRPQLPEDIAVSNDEWELLRLTNKERYKAGVGLLVMVSPLQDAGEIRSKEIVIVMRKEHLRPDGKPYHTAIEASFANSRYTSENCIKGSATPARSIKGWLNSDGHKANMLNSQWCYFGCGMTEAEGMKHWVQMFSTGNGVQYAETNTGSNHFNTLAEMEEAHLICYLGEGIKAYIPLDADYMVKNGNQYKIHLGNISVTVSVGDNEPQN
ncbi:MAG: CAP domain-containing protein [Bacteroidaceae bacterium]|nr:CAP domain-containing protein [Bacteroidaceae bacterium]